MTLRIGILGTSRVAGYAILAPAAKSPRAKVTAIGGRTLERTERYARKHRIDRVLPDYQSVIECDEVDAIYIPLPNALHHPWTLAALAAGKHVLCEKPLAANRAQAIELRDAVQAAECILMTGFHYRHHSLMERLVELRNDDELGTLESLDAAFCLFWPKLSDIRYSYELAGGALMDIGCYPVNLLRFLAGSDGSVDSATAELVRPNVDGSMRAELKFNESLTARIRCALRARPWQWRSWLRMQFSAGEVRVLNPFVPHAFHRVIVRSASGKSRERIDGPTTYEAQLDAFIDVVLGKKTSYPDADEAIGDATLIDAIYEAAGLDPR